MAQRRHAKVQPAGVLTLALALCAWSAFMAQGANIDPAKRWDQGGIICYAVPSVGSPEVWVTAVFRAGRTMEPQGRRGLADLTATTAELALEEAIAAGAPMTLESVTVTPWWVSLAVRLPADRLSDGLRALAGALRGASDDAARIASARARLISRLKDRTPKVPASVQRAFVEGVLGPNAVGQEPLVTEATSLTPEQVQAFHRSTWVRNNLWLAVAGPEEAALVNTEIKAAFEGWHRRSMEVAPPQAAPARGTAEVRTITMPVGQAVSIRGGLGPGRWDPERHVSAVLGVIVEEAVAELGGGAGTIDGLPALWWVWLPAKVTPGLDERLATLAASGISEAAVARARARLSGDIALAVRSPAGLVARYATGEAMGYPGDHWKQEVKRLARVRLSDVRRLARKRFAGGAPAGLEVAPSAAPTP